MPKEYQVYMPLFTEKWVERTQHRRSDALRNRNSRRNDRMFFFCGWCEIVSLEWHSDADRVTHIVYIIKGPPTIFVQDVSYPRKSLAYM